ncbi:MAG TPA: hypothetical protein ENI05_04630 [Porticoccus sp.]|nr:hypothetical protein [Porticoccus sp.]
MSYILEALKESQRSRDEQPVPDISTVQASPELDSEPERTHRGGLIALLVLIVVLGAGGGWWFAGQPGKEDQPQASLPVSQPVPSQPIAATEVQAPIIQDTPAEEVVVQTAVVAEVVEGVATESVPEMPAVVDKEPVVSVPAVNEAVVNEVVVNDAMVDQEIVSPIVKSVPDEVVVIDEPPTPLMATTEAVVIQAEPAVEAVVLSKIQPDIQPETQVMVHEIQAEQVVAAAEAQVEPVAPVSDIVDESLVLESESEATDTLPVAEEVLPEVEQERVPHYRELPFDIQQGVQGVHFSVHLFSPNPVRRLVKIKGVVHREGSEVSPGLILDEVVQNGAIFTYRDYRFWVPVQ